MLELQNYARTLMASKKGNPSVTDGLTGSAFYPLFTPANEVVPGEEAPPEMRPFTPTVPRAQPERRPSLTHAALPACCPFCWPRRWPPAARAVRTPRAAGSPAAGAGARCPARCRWAPWRSRCPAARTARSRACRRPSRTPRSRCCTRAVDEGYEPRVTLVNVDGRPVSAGSETFSTDAGNAHRRRGRPQRSSSTGFGEAVTGPARADPGGRRAHRPRPRRALRRRQPAGHRRARRLRALDGRPARLPPARAARRAARRDGRGPAREQRAAGAAGRPRSSSRASATSPSPSRRSAPPSAPRWSRCGRRSPPRAAPRASRWSTSPAAGTPRATRRR